VKDLDALIGKAKEDPRILAVLLYGSRARGDEGPGSDVDVCLVLTPEAARTAETARVQMDFLGFPELDVRIFQRLPLYVRQRVLHDGRVLLVKEEDSLYEIASRTVREFEDFRPYYRAYLDAVAHG
jgi:predicted nucleotidyltransferase